MEQLVAKLRILGATHLKKFDIFGDNLKKTTKSDAGALTSLATTPRESPEMNPNSLEPVDLAKKLALFDEHYQPHVVGLFNGHDIMLAKLKGPFVWHKHDDTDDLFLVLRGELTIRLRTAASGGLASDRPHPRQNRDPRECS